MNANVKVNYEELHKLLKEIVVDYVLIDVYAKQINDSLLSEDNWNSKASRVFHGHIRQELLPFLKEIEKGIEQYVNYIDKIIPKYKQIDRF